MQVPYYVHVHIAHAVCIVMSPRFFYSWFWYRYLKYIVQNMYSNIIQILFLFWLSIGVWKCTITIFLMFLQEIVVSTNNLWSTIRLMFELNWHLLNCRFTITQCPPMPNANTCVLLVIISKVLQSRVKSYLIICFIYRL